MIYYEFTHENYKQNNMKYINADTYFSANVLSESKEANALFIVKLFLNNILCVF